MPSQIGKIAILNLNVSTTLVLKMIIPSFLSFPCDQNDTDLFTHVNQDDQATSLMIFLDSFP